MHICFKSLGKHVDFGAVWATGREWVVSQLVDSRQVKNQSYQEGRSSCIW